MKSLTIFLIIVLCTLSISASCIKEEQNPEAQKSSAFSEFVGDITCGIKIGAKKTGDAIRNSYGYVKDKLTPKKDEEKFDVRAAGVDLSPDSKVEVATIASMTVDDRSLFEAPCKGFTDRNGVCRQSD